MNALDDLIRATLDARAHDVDHVHLYALVPRPARSGRWVAVATVVALAAAVVVAVVLVAPWRGASHRTAQPADALTPSAPPAGMKWVSYHGITLTVPTTWAAGSFACDTPATPGVVFIGVSPLQCLPVPRAGQAFLTLMELGTESPKGTATTVGGRPAYLDTSPGSGPDETAAVQLPAAGVELVVTLPVGGTTSMSQILDSVEYTPVDHLGCSARLPMLTDDMSGPGRVDATGVASAVVCDYGYPDSQQGVPFLVGSRELSDQELHRLEHTLATATPGAPDSTRPSTTTAGVPVYLLRRPGRASIAVYVDAGRSPVTVSDGGTARSTITDDQATQLPRAYP